jgi:hypothetical protein
LFPCFIVDGVDSGVISRITVTDEFDNGVFWNGSESFFERDESIASSSGIGDVIGMDSAGVGSDGEPCVVPSVEDADIGFISGDTRVDGAFMMEIELMAEDSGGIGVVENGLMRDGYLKDVLEHVSRHSGTEAV